MTKPPTFDSTGRLHRDSPAWRGFPLVVAVVVAAHGLFCAVLLLQGCSKDTGQIPAQEQPPTNGLPSVQELWKTVTARSNRVAGARPPAPPSLPSRAAGGVRATNRPPAPTGGKKPATAAAPSKPPVKAVPADRPVAALQDLTNRPPTQRILTNAAPKPAAKPASRQPDTSRQLAKAREHVVQPGDTLWGISRKYGVSVAEIERANPNLVPTRLQINSTLIIPPPREKQAAQAEAKYPGTLHTVQRGDTLSHLARRYGVTIQDIQRENGLRTTTIRVGQKLKIPTHKRGNTSDRR